MKSRRIAAFIVVTAALRVRHGTLTAAGTTAQPAPPAPAAQSSSGLQLDAMDKSVDACTDFYQFACGDWMAKNPVPADRSSWGRFDELQERNNETLQKILESRRRRRAMPARRRSATTTPRAWTRPRSTRRAPRRSIRCSKKIAALTSPNALAPLVAELHTIGVNPFFSFGAEADFKDASVEMAIADQGGMGLPDRDYYFRDDAKSVELRKQYVEHVGEDGRRCSATRPDRATAAAQQRDEDRDGAGEGGARRRLAPRPEQDLPQALGRGAAGADAAVSMAAVLHAASARRRSTRSTSPSPTSSRRSARRSRRRRSTRSRRICAGTSRTRRRRSCRRRSSTRTSASTARTLTGRQGAAAALEALRAVHRRRSRRSARPGVRRRKPSARRPRPTR